VAGLCAKKRKGKIIGPDINSITALFDKYLFHWTPSKALWIGGYTLLWDARCSGIYIGFGISIIYHFFCNWRTSAFPPPFVFFISFVMIATLPIDVATIVLGVRAPSNDIRFLTGLLFGASVCVFLYPSFIMLTSKNIQSVSALSTCQKMLLHYMIVASTLIILKWNNIFSYALLSGLSIFGFFCLVVMLIGCLSKTLFNICDLLGERKNKCRL